MRAFLRIHCLNILLSYLLCHPVNAFYYDHQLNSIPPELLEPYKAKHHLSDAFEDIFDRALNAYVKMDFERAEQAYNTLLLINSRDIITLDRLAQVYLKQGKFDRSAQALLQALRIEPTYYPAHDLLARLYLYKKDFKQSIRHAKFLIEGGHAYIDTYLTLINALFSMSQFDNVLAICKIARNAGAVHPQLQFFPALIALIEGNLEKFVQEQLQFQRDFASHPDLDLYNYLFAAVREDRTQVKRLSRDIRKASFVHPVYPYTFLTLALEEIALVTKKEGLWDLAISMADGAISAAPAFLLPYRIGLEILRRKRDFESILPLTEKGLQYFEDYIAFYEFRGEAAFFLKQNDLALESLQKALKVRNNNPDFLAYAGILMLLDPRNDPRDALALLDLSTNLERNNPFAQSGFGLYYYNSEELQRATIPLKQAIGQSVLYDLPYELMIRIERESDNLVSAYKIALKAREIIKSVGIYKHVVELAFERTEYRNCVKLGQEASFFFKEEKYFPFLMAKALRELKEYPKALSVMEEVGANPENPEEYNQLYLNLLVDLKLYDDANRVVNELISAKPNVFSYRRFLAQFKYLQKDYQEALKLFEELIRLTRSRVYMVDTGWLNYILNNKEKGIQELLLATKQGSKENRALAHYRLGIIYSIRKKTQLESSQNYSKGYELSPRLKKAINDHEIFNQVTDYKHEKTLEKNKKLYLE